MNTKTVPLLSSSRRRFIASAAGIVVAGLAATSPLSLLSLPEPGSIDLASPTPIPKRLHLDLQEAKRIGSQFVADEQGFLSFLDLTDYASVSLNALDHLTHIDASFTSLGFEWIDPAMAKLLARWESYFLTFNKLDKLTPEITRVLNSSNHPLVFMNLKHLDVETAEYLVHEGTLPLHIRSLAELSPPLAKVLSRHAHELYLSVTSLEPLAADALSRHQGYNLSVTSKLAFPEDTLQAFAGDAMKHLSTDSGEYGYKLTWAATDEWRQTSSS